MDCSYRFTTYESTEERLLPFLITKNAAQGATIPNVNTMLSIMSSTLAVLSEETENLIGKVDKFEKTHVAKRKDEAKEISKKRAHKKKKQKSLTSIEQVVNIIKDNIQGDEEGIFEEGITLDEAVKDYEKRIILEALEKSNWVKARAARLLNINRTTLVEKIKKQNLAEPGSA